MIIAWEWAIVFVSSDLKVLIVKTCVVSNYNYHVYYESMVLWMVPLKYIFYRIALFQKLVQLSNKI